MPTPKHESASHVTDHEAQAVADFAAEVAEALHLPRYRFNVSVEPSEDDALASIDTVRHRWIAEIRLNKDWMNRSDEDRMNCIVHEVCHLLHRGVDYVVGRNASRFMHNYEYDQIWTQYRREAEMMVDHLAMFISDFTSIKKSWATLHRKKR